MLEKAAMSSERNGVVPRLRIPVAMAVGVLALTGCSDDEDPTGPPEPGETTDVTVSGTVTSAYDGSGLAGAEVSVHDAGDGTALDETTTGADGDYELAFTVTVGEEPDELRLEISADGHEPGEETFAFAESVSRDVSVEALMVEATVAGEVVEQLSGDPVSGAEVSAHRSDGGDPLGEGTTDDEGAYEIAFEVPEVDVPEELRVEAEGAGYEHEESLAFQEDLTLHLALGPFAGGTGSEEDPYLLATADELQAMEKDLAGHYRLAGDIDASETAEWNDGAGFEPIGHWEDFDHEDNDPFTGHIDGDGHAIEGLTIHRPEENGVGLLAKTGEETTVVNLRLDGADVEGNQFVGALAGRMESTPVDGVSVDGDVVGSQTTGGLAGAAGDPEIHDAESAVAVAGEDGSVGGLVGYLEGGEVHGSMATGDVHNTASNPTGGLVGSAWWSVISESSATAAVEGIEAVGGLVGLATGTEIERSVATGQVIGDEAVGGLAGQSDLLIEASFATGTVEGEDDIGGLVGRADGEIRTSFSTARVIGTGVNHGGMVGRLWGVVRESFAAGAISGGEDVGGLIGQNDGEIIFGYWDTSATDQDDGVGEGDDDGASGFETDEMTGDAAESNMTGLDFDDDWTVVEGDYPRLWWEGS